MVHRISFLGLQAVLREQHFENGCLPMLNVNSDMLNMFYICSKTYLIDEILLNIKHVFTVTVVHDSLNSKLKILNGANRVRQNFQSSHPCMVKSEKSLVEKL